MMPPLEAGTRRPRITPQIVVGLGIVAMGLLLTAGNLGWVEVDDLWRYWPLIVIAGGLAKFLTASTTAGRVTGTGPSAPWPGFAGSIVAKRIRESDVNPQQSVRVPRRRFRRKARNSVYGCKTSFCARQFSNSPIHSTFSDGQVSA